MKNQLKTQRVMHFTLIELLVVIAIIAILAGMLMPALNKARARGRTATCTSQLKDLSVSMRMYADAFNDWYLGHKPYDKTKGYSMDRNWASVLHMTKFFADNNAKYIDSYCFSGRMLCPELHPLAQWKEGRLDGTNIYGVARDDRQWKELYNNYYLSGQYNKFLRIRKPGEFIYIADALTQTTKKPTQSFYKQMGSSNDGYIAKTHSKMGNVSFLDGHVGLVTVRSGYINRMIDLN